jgi:small nuclear ribonucleoprotein (snRNP)-like protein
MSEEFDEDINKKVKLFLKIGRKYEGKIKRGSKNNFIHITDKFNSLVKIAEDNIGSIEYE